MTLPMIYLLMFATSLFIIHCSNTVFFVNILRRFKGLEPTFPHLYYDQKYLIRSHGKWIKTGKKSTLNHFDIYKCKECGVKLLNNKFAYIADPLFDNKYKNKTCAQIIMEDVME